MRWNEREKQKSFVVVEEDAESPDRREVVDSGKGERRRERVGEDGRAVEARTMTSAEDGDGQGTVGRAAVGAEENAQERQPDMGDGRREKSKQKAEAGMGDPDGDEAHRDLEREEDEEDEDDEYDIDEYVFFPPFG